MQSISMKIIRVLITLTVQNIIAKVCLVKVTIGM